MNWLQALILSVLQGLTEFLPISSTGHMIIASTFMGISHNDFTKLFEVVVQFGSILSVLVLYWRKFVQSVNFYVKLFVAFIPAVIVGFLFGKQIDALLENIVIVGLALFIGGIIFLFIDKWFKNAYISDDKSINNKMAFKIGLFQCIAMIPGVSRSAATIIGGLSQKLTRKTAAEFSFFLAVPTMLAASVKKIYDFIISNHESVTKQQINLLILGNIVSFIVAMLAIKTFITYLTNHGFKVFGYYRIFAGLLIFLLIFLGKNISF